MKAAGCVFCKVIEGGIPSERVYQDERFVCIRDLHPQAKVHLLVIPRTHVASLDEVFPEGKSGDPSLAGELLSIVTRIARQEGLLPGGFRTVINTGKNGGQSVSHLHIHVLGGRQMAWPPG